MGGEKCAKKKKKKKKVFGIDGSSSRSSLGMNSRKKERLKREKWENCSGSMKMVSAI